MNRVCTMMALCVLLAGCAGHGRNAEVLATDNPMAGTYQVRELIVLARNVKPENARYLESRLCDGLRGHVLSCDSGSTRYEEAAQAGLDSFMAALPDKADTTLLILQRTTDRSKAEYLGSVQWGEFGSSPSDPNVQNTPIERKHRVAAGIASLVDASNRGEIWSAHIHVEGYDEKSGDQFLMNAAADELVRKLLHSPHFH